jgi:hypothetical protein
MNHTTQISGVVFQVNISTVVTDGHSKYKTICIVGPDSNDRTSIIESYAVDGWSICYSRQTTTRATTFYSKEN